MSNFQLLARRLVLLWGLSVGCSEGPPSPPLPNTTDLPAGAPPATPPPTPTSATPNPNQTSAPAIETVVAQLDTDLGRLRGLQIVSVETLVVANGAESHGCYSLHPCDANISYPTTAAEYRRQAPRLDRLVDLAETVAARPTAKAVDTAVDVAALNALQIVTSSGLLLVAPSQSRNCYGVPCPEEIARDKQENQRRADVLHSLIVEAAGAGL